MPEKEDDDSELSDAEAYVTSPTTAESVIIWEPADMDVLSGRGASVNAHNGNKKFRALCFSRKFEFDAGNNVAKRRVAEEIVRTATRKWNTRWLRKKDDKWVELDHEQAIQKASQIIRDYKRPDRISRGESKKPNRATATPMDFEFSPAPTEAIVENPYGVHDHDILCGRGAYVNSYVIAETQWI
jgi:hypothetical protein